jgi:hypothetical protein
MTDYSYCSKSSSHSSSHSSSYSSSHSSSHSSSYCIICCENKKDITFTKCSHIFCTDCYVKWLSNHDQCPLCRTSLKQTEKIECADEYMYNDSDIPDDYEIMDTSDQFSIMNDLDRDSILSQTIKIQKILLNGGFIQEVYKDDSDSDISSIDYDDDEFDLISSDIYLNSSSIF